MPRALPWWVDGGLWLKYSNGLLGNTWPLWDEKPLNYPPLFTSLLSALISITGNHVASIKAAAVLAFATRPASAYVASYLIYGKKPVSILVALTMMFLPLHVEMLGWGGYPNLLALSMITIALSILVTWLRGDVLGWKTLAILFLITVLIPLTHNLTFLIYETTLLTILLVALFLKRIQLVIKVLSLSIAAFGAYSVYIFTLNWPPQYVIHNQAAYHRLLLNLESGILTWMFKNNWILISLYIFMSLTIIYSVHRRRNLIETAVLGSWLVAPLLLLNLHHLGIALDYNRVFYFIVDPLVFLAIGFSFFLAKRMERNSDPYPPLIQDLLPASLRSNISESLEKVAVVVLLGGIVITSFSTLYTGVQTFTAIENWYNFRDLYGDREKLEAVKWIMENTPSESVIVAEEEIARWIEGIAARRVLMYAHPMFLFIPGEQERAYMAKSILLSWTALNSTRCILYEPLSPVEKMSTRISLYFQGAYSEILFLNNSNTYVLAKMNNQLIRATILEANAYSVSEQGNELIITYSFKYFTLEKKLYANEEDGACGIRFQVTPNAGADVEELVVDLAMWPKAILWEAWVEPGAGLKLVTSEGEIYVKSSGITALPFRFVKNNGTIVGYIEAYPLSSEEVAGGAKIIHARDIIRTTGAKYIVIPRIQNPRLHENIPLTPQTRPEYMHLLHNKFYRIIYQNAKVIVLEFEET
ncbi:MAG: hypothetical protein QXX41_01150 [Nitrososphaerota archaeon]